MRDTFHYSTSINGIDCSFLNINDAMKKLEKTMNSTQITFLFADNKEYTVKLFPEQNAECRFPYIPGSCIYAYCNKHGLWKKDVD